MVSDVRNQPNAQIGTFLAIIEGVELMLNTALVAVQNESHNPGRYFDPMFVGSKRKLTSFLFLWRVHKSPRPAADEKQKMTPVSL